MLTHKKFFARLILFSIGIFSIFNKSFANNNILVLGSTGGIGSEVVKILNSVGYSLKLTTRHKSKVDKNTVYLDVVTGEGLHEAFEGVDKAFFIAPPGYADQYGIIAPLIKEAKDRKLKKVVLLTVMGTTVDESISFRKAEVDLINSGLNYSIVRPTWFMQNFHTFWLHDIKTQGKILLPAGSKKVSFIDARDIAAVVAKLLISNEFNYSAFDLTGPQAFDHSDAAELISEASGRPVSYEEISPIQFKNKLVGAGIPAEYADYLNKVFGVLRSGYHETVSVTVKDITGQNPRTLRDYVFEFKDSWK